MFSKILAFIRDWINKMIGQTNIKQALSVDVSISQPMVEALNTWSLMYENKAEWLSEEVKSLNIPASISGEIARLATIEMKVTIDGGERAKYLTSQMENVMREIRNKVELGCAKGGLMMKPYPNGKNISVDFVQADQFYPVSFDANGSITSCIFSDQKKIGNDIYTRLEYHAMTDNGCQIKNVAFKSTSKGVLGNQVSLDSVAAWAGLQPEATITGVDKPLYAYFKYPLANNIDPTSPLGVSCYSRSVDLIKNADSLFSNLMWEFESGKRALYVDTMAFERDSNNKPILTDKRLYRTLNALDSAQIGEPGFFQAWSPEFREVSIKSGLDAILKKIEFNCGLAFGTISDPQTVDKTATEIKISRQRTYATVTDTQKALQDALDQLIWAMDVYASLYKLAARGDYSTVYDFDDSVVVDKDAAFQQDLRLVGSNIMGKVEFRMRNFGEDEATAKKMVEMAAPAPDTTSMFQGA